MIKGSPKQQDKEPLPINFIPISKTIKLENGETIAGLDVKTHCLITGYVAQSLIEKYPECLQNLLFPQGAALLAACHDIGKISPAFQKMIYDSISKPDPAIITALSSVNSDAAKRTEYAFHAKVTQTLLAEKPKYIPDIEGMHHGFRPNSTPCTEAVYGGVPWTKMRHDLLLFLEDCFLAPEQEWPTIGDWNKASVLGGLIIVADWIASGGEFAGLTRIPPSNDCLQQMAEKAVSEAGFVSFQVQQNLSFSDIFGFQPYPIQTSFFESVTGPGVYILEAPMGIGKTEAALYAAYRIIALKKATGMYFGLPTQLTSNKIYERVRQFLDKVTSANASPRLLHSSAWLEEMILGEEGDTGRSWFDSSKRGILAPFAVGTVDQALMAVMNIRHGMVRAFGLAGKVVILDEVHSYDAYTGTLLSSLVQCLREIGCTVLILSATLTSSQKSNLLGRNNDNQYCAAYPLVTSLCNANDTEKELYESTVQSKDERTVTINFCQDSSNAFEPALEKAENGQQVLWIENTVDEAQNIYRQIAARTESSKIECGLVHSRFIRKRRSENEAYWVSLYGKDGHDRRKERGRILIGTQVLEQSLDIDADFLITHICPTDMLLQRIGRLWRHKENNDIRPKGSLCSVLIIAPAYENTTDKRVSFGVSTAIYSEYILCRTLEIWKNVRTLHLPGDIRNLLEQTYLTREEKGIMRKLKDDMLAVKRRLEGFARIAQATDIQTFSESAVQTRYSDMENCKVLLLRSFEKVKEAYVLSFADEKDTLQIPTAPTSLLPIARRHIAMLLEEHCVVVAERNAPPYDREVEVFSPYIYTGSQEDDEHPFRAAIIGPDDYLQSIRHDLLTTYSKRFLYNAILGYQILNDRR
ncbi:MAG: CRISPR-associated helicase Cas3' [Syntrophaceae bacterium]